VVGFDVRTAEFKIGEHSIADILRQRE